VQWTLRASANPRQFSAIRHLHNSSAADSGYCFNDRNIISFDDISDYSRLLPQRMMPADIDAIVGDFRSDDRDKLAFVCDIKDVKTKRIGSRLDCRIYRYMGVVYSYVKRGLARDFVQCGGKAPSCRVTHKLNSFGFGEQLTGQIGESGTVAFKLGFETDIPPVSVSASTELSLALIKLRPEIKS